MSNGKKRCGLLMAYNTLCILVSSCSCDSPTQNIAHSNNTNSQKDDSQILEIINGMYEVVEWNDGEKTHRPPEVSGRWVFHDKKVMVILHDRTDPELHKSKFGWGHGTVERGKFQYTYTDNLNLKGTNENSSFTLDLPFEGMRFFKIEIKNDGIEMKSDNGKQTWIINKKGMLYTDIEWGPDKVFTRRKWKRISE